MQSALEARASTATHLLRDGLDNRLVEISTDDGTIRLDSDAVLGAVGHDVLLLAERVQLDREDLQYQPTKPYIHMLKRVYAPQSGSPRASRTPLKLILPYAGHR